MTIERINHELFVQGWSLFEAGLNDNKLLKLAEELGSVIPDNNGQIIQYLRPKDNREGGKGTFSYNFGHSAFPYHTDTAYWPLPARYVIMKSEHKSLCDTYLLDFNQVLGGCNSKELLLLKKSVFVEKTFTGQKFTSFIVYNSGTTGIRYDPNIMISFNTYSTKLVGILNRFFAEKEPIQIKWTGDNILIIDNWRILHSRGSSLEDKNRLLKRIYFR